MSSSLSAGILSSVAQLIVVIHLEKGAFSQALHCIWCKMSFVNGGRDLFQESADLLYSKLARHQRR
jgi:hypothetical protein